MTGITVPTIFFLKILHFRLQPNLETKKKQVQAWCDLFLAYHRHKRIYTLDLKEAANSDLFNNAKLSSILSEIACYGQ